MTHNDSGRQKRTDALAQFREAQKMLTEGRADLVRAEEKIERAQKLIDRSANVIRETWTAARPGRVSKKK